MNGENADDSSPHFRLKFGRGAPAKLHAHLSYRARFQFGHEIAFLVHRLRSRIEILFAGLRLLHDKPVGVNLAIESARFAIGNGGKRR